jgi:hypothetical protein
MELFKEVQVCIPFRSDSKGKQGDDNLWRLVTINKLFKSVIALWSNTNASTSEVLLLVGK